MNHVLSNILRLAAAGTLLTAMLACSSSSSSTGSGGTTSSSSASTGSGGSCTTQMYAKYGPAAFTTVTDDLVKTAAADPQIGHYFAALTTTAEVTAFEASLDQFIVGVYGGPNDYTGPDMATAHKGLHITSADYTYFVGLIVKDLESNGVSDSDVTDCFAPPITAAAFEASIVGM
jgi:truncated hemoglobin YjbI